MAFRKSRKLRRNLRRKSRRNYKGGELLDADKLTIKGIVENLKYDLKTKHRRYLDSKGQETDELKLLVANIIRREIILIKQTIDKSTTDIPLSYIRKPLELYSQYNKDNKLKLSNEDRFSLIQIYNTIRDKYDDDVIEFTIDEKINRDKFVEDTILKYVFDLLYRS
jgi:hypothetical protein